MTYSEGQQLEPPAATTVPPRLTNDASPPPNWPPTVVYLSRPRLSPTFPAPLLPSLVTPSHQHFSPRPTLHPASVVIKTVTTPSHPAHGQRSLVAKKRIPASTLIIPYLGIIHCTLTPAENAALHPSPPPSALADPHADSDYDLSLLRLSASDIRNPYPGYHVSVGVDAAQAGNAARFVNDYRGVAGAPNAEFRVGRGEGGEMRMEVWALKAGVAKGDEVLVSYGKGWWGARK